MDEYNETMTDAADDAHELDEALSGGRMWSDESAIDAELQEMFGDGDQGDPMGDPMGFALESPIQLPTVPTGGLAPPPPPPLPDAMLTV